MQTMENVLGASLVAVKCVRGFTPKVESMVTIHAQSLQARDA